MTIYDKAHWQVDGGIEENLVIDHFNFIFTWLDEFDLLSDYGKKTLADGVDGDIILTDEMVNHSGKLFLDKHYDEYIAKIDYGKSEDATLLEKMYYQL